MKKLTALIIMDGYGLTKGENGNCIGKGGGEYIKRLMRKYPSATLQASGPAVGLPEGQMGNSEVGHLNIGAGRVVWQELTRISERIADKSFYDNTALVGAIQHAKKCGSSLHIMGLLGDGGVHSHISHLYAILELAKAQGLVKVFVHCFTDGRDTSPTSGVGFMKDLKVKLTQTGVGEVASVCGRYYAMDRDNRWERVEKAYNMLTLGEGERVEDAEDALLRSYEKGITDEFILPTVMIKNGEPVATIKDDDAVILYNYRPDRVREITRAFTQDDFYYFVKSASPSNIKWICMTQYDSSFKNVEIAFLPQNLENTLGRYLAAQGKTQLRIAETEKYAHVTFFFNAGVEEADEGEARILIPSPKVPTYDLKPEMSAYGIRDEALRQIDGGNYDLMVLNFANCDMVGHTGVIPATEKAVKVVEECVESLVDRIIACGGRAIVTADHGNAERLLDDEGMPYTAHTLNPVPFILVDSSFSLENFDCGDLYRENENPCNGCQKDGASEISRDGSICCDSQKEDLCCCALNNDRRINVPNVDQAVLLPDGKLCDIAPTILELMSIEKPEEMTGHSLVLHKRKLYRIFNGINS